MPRCRADAAVFFSVSITVRIVVAASSPNREGLVRLPVSSTLWKILQQDQPTSRFEPLVLGDIRVQKHPETGSFSQCRGGTP